ARITIKNRRKRYLDTHPDYFSSPSLELADPLAYDRLVRRFQTPSERESEGRKKGYSGVLEADLWRSEAKIGALANPDHAALMRYRRDASGEIVAEEKDEVPQNKEDGMQRWRKEMELMFLRGDDGDFDYKIVDESEDFDDRGVQEREEEEKWFEKEEPSWIEEKENDGLMGETGVQDY
ncbi:coiled-coil domain-containing protein-domain-containing protein, partial [Usnea florida]